MMAQVEPKGGAMPTLELVKITKGGYTTVLRGPATQTFRALVIGRYIQLLKESKNKNIIAVYADGILVKVTKTDTPK